jgi:hypothetical protein
MKRDGGGATATMAMFSRCLKALGYPQSESFDATEQVQLRNLVVWLEDMKIRRYKIADRADLNAAADITAPAVQQYLADIGCSATTPMAIAEYLINHALSLEFRDATEKSEGDETAAADMNDGDGDETTATAAAAAAVPGHVRAARIIEQNTDYASKEWKEAAAKLAAIMGTELPPDVGDGQASHTAAVFRAIANTLHRKFSAYLDTPLDAGEPKAK